MIDPQSIDLDSLPSVTLEARSQLPETSCIYFAIDAQGLVQYIGQSRNARQRWNAHDRYKKLLQLGDIKIAYLSVSSPELLPEIESALIAWFDPPLNIIGRRIATGENGEVKVRTARNLRPKTEHLKDWQYKPLGDRNLSEKVIGTRYPIEVYEALTAMESSDRQQLIREAVEKEMCSRGLV